MPRKKKALSRGSSPEKAVGSDFASSAGQYGQPYLNNPPSAWDMAWQSPNNGRHGSSGQDHDQTFQQLQDMFEGKVEAEVVYMVLQECDWKVDEAVEKLCILTSGPESDQTVIRQQSRIHSNVNQSTRLFSQASKQSVPSEFGTHNIESNMTTYVEPCSPSQMEKLLPDFSQYTSQTGSFHSKPDLSSRFPPVNLGPIPTSTEGLPMLSPKTPAIANIDFPFPQAVENVSGEGSIQSALEALDSYANNMALPGYQRQQSFSTHLSDFQNHGVESPSAIPGLQTTSPHIPATQQPQSSQGLQFGNGDPRSHFGLTTRSPVSSNGPSGFGNPLPNASLGITGPSYSARSRSLSPQCVLQSRNGIHRPVVNQQVSHESTGSISEEGSLRTQMSQRQGSTSSSSDTPSSANSVSSPFFTKAPMGASNVLPSHDSPGLPMSLQLTPITACTERSNSSESQPDPMETAKKNPMQILRHQNISLDPTERENLERLIEEVIRGGVGEDALDYSEESSSDEEEVATPNSDIGEIKALQKKELEEIKASIADGTPIPQSNLKVAAKHMKNLPPRFLKRLQAVNAEDEEPDSDDTSPERPESPQSDKDERKKSNTRKKKKRELLKGLDVFMDEQGVKVLQLVPSTEDPPNESPKEQFHMTDSQSDLDQMTPTSVQASHVPEVNVSSVADMSCDKQHTSDLEIPVVRKPEYLGSSSCEEARASPKPNDHADGANKSGTNTPKNMKSLINPNIILRQDAVNCEELEKELMKITGQARESPKPYKPRPRHPAVLSEPPKVCRITEPDRKSQQTKYLDKVEVDEVDKATSQFSVNAPEFVPRSFTPINVPVSTSVAEPVMVIPPTVKSRSPFRTVMGRHSPQVPLYVTHTPPGRHSPAHSPAFMIPKVPHNMQNAAVAAAMHARPAVSGVVPVQHHYPMQPYPYHPQYPHYSFHPPFMPPHHGHPYPTWITDTPEKHLTGRSIIHPYPAQPGHHGVSPHKDKLHVRGQQHLVATSRSSSAPTIVPVNPKMAANLQPVTLYPMAGNTAADPSTKAPRAQPISRERSPLVKQASVKHPRDVVESLVKEGKKVMVLMRGCPGSGKSTLAREINFGGIILSTDDYFQKGDVYEYDVSQLSDAHEWNQKRTKDAIAAGTTPIIIDNTNTTAWEMKFYVAKALENDYHVEIVEPDTAWKFKVKELTKRNSHGVPSESIQRMVDRYEHNLTVASIMGKNESQENAEEEPEQNQDATNQDPEKKKKRRKRRRKRKTTDNKKSLDGENSSDDETTDGTCTSREASLDVDDNPDDKPKPTTDAIIGGSIEEEEEELIKDETTTASPMRNDILAFVGNSSPSFQADSKNEDCAGPIKCSDSNSNTGKLLTEVVNDNILSSALAGKNREGSDSSSSSCRDEKFQEDTLQKESGAEKGEKHLKRSHRIPLKLHIGPGKNNPSPVKDSNDYRPGPAEHLETPDFLKADIEEFIKDKILEGLINEEVAQITGHSGQYSAGYSASASLVKPVPVMQAAGGDSEVDNQKDVSCSGAEELTNCGELPHDVITSSNINKGLPSSAQSSSIEECYWTKSVDVPDPYTVKVESNEIVVSSFATSSPKEINTELDQVDEKDNNQLSTPKPKREKRERKTTGTDWDSDGSPGWEKMRVENKSYEDAASPHSSSVPTTPVTPCTPSSASKKSPVKKRLAAKFPGPHLDSDFKDQLKSSDWQLPSFDSPETTNMLSSSLVPSITTKTVQSFTEPADFSIVHKVLQGITVRNFNEMFVQVLDTFARDIQEVGVCVKTMQLSPSHIEKLKIDKSCSTDDLQQSIGNDEQLDFLINCFPSVSIEDLNDILNLCDGNTEWAINILLDSGYEYNEPNAGNRRPGSLLNNNDLPDTTENPNPRLEEEGEIVIPSVDDGQHDDVALETDRCKPCTPPPLMILCHSSLEPSETLLSTTVQGDIVQKSVQRLESIEAFKLERSLSMENSSDPNALEASSNTLDLPGEDPDLVVSKSCHVPSVGSDRHLKRLLSADGKKKILTTVYTPEVEKCKDEDVILEEVTETVIVEDSESGADIGAAGITDVAEGGASAVGHPSELMKEKGCGVQDLFSQLASHYEVAGAEMGALSPDMNPLSPSGSANEMGMLSKIDLPSEGHKELSNGVEDEGHLTFTLNPALAQQLIAMFGPVGFHISPDSLDADDLRVRLNQRVARQIHRRWALSLQEKFTLEEIAINRMIQEDEALARKLQREEEERHMQLLHREAPSGTNHERSLSPSKKPQLPAVVGIQADSKSSEENNPEVRSPCVVRASHIKPAASLQEIMDEELAIQRSKEEYDQMMSETTHATSLASKINLKKLQEMYYNIDPAVVEDIFKGSGCSLDKALELIQGSNGSAPKCKNTMTEEESAAHEAMLISRAQQESLMDQWLGSAEDEGNPDFQSMEDPDYQDFRAEASHHYRLRHECFQKAQEAYRRNMKSVASFYSQQGHLHTLKLREANHRAAERIMDHRNAWLPLTNQVDLHGLHVDEAVEALDRVITQRKQELKHHPDKRRMHLSVITGKGNHSRHGIARIKPAIITYLKNKNYNFTEPQPGVLRLQLKYRDIT